MKRIKHLLLAGIVAGCYSIGSAQINDSKSTAGALLIYSNNFTLGSSGVNIAGKRPVQANSILGGSSSAAWEDVLGINDTNGAGAPLFFGADGSVPGTPNSLLLPFTPQNGHVYTLTASLTFSGNPGSWVGLGFAQRIPLNANYGYGRFSDGGTTPPNQGPNGYDWIILTESSGNVQFFKGPGGGGQLISQNAFFPPNSPAAHTVKVILDTTGASWALACYVDGVQAASGTYASGNPPIGAVGLTGNALGDPGAVQWNSFALSAAGLALVRQPVSASVVAGTAFTNTVAAMGSSPISYQWYANNVPIGGATNASLIFNPVTTNDASPNYYAVVSNSYGAVTSAVASLTVLTDAFNPIATQLVSPDGSLTLTFAVTNFDGSVSCPVYSLDHNGRTILAPSKLGLTLDAGGLLQEHLEVVSQGKKAYDSTWRPVYAEKNLIRDNYNELVVNLREAVPPNRLLQLSFRAYNEGVAFCYTIPSQAGLTAANNLGEKTEFRFDADHAAWATYTAQGVYSQTTISGIGNGCERPLVIQLATNVFTALGEARQVDYSRMKFGPLSGAPYSLVSQLDSPVTCSLPLTTPWRFIMCADTPGRLVENNFLVLNLNDPCALTNTSWIKPGKVIRETTLKTASAKACVDFAARHNIQYIEFDAGWYGPEHTTLNATNAISGIDMPGVIGYAASNNVGVILYVNWRAMTNELTVHPPLYQGWGVKGIKYGFVSVGSQQFTGIVNEAVRICATNRIMVDVHDEFRPSGYTRTYPNFMTAEGISGDETTPATSQDTTLLFTRMLLGGGDHTVCYFEKRVTNNWSFAYQLAKAVCFYSPWQFIYWYDRPTNSYAYVDGGNAMITEVPEMEFYDYMPTVWDQTRVLQGSIGQYAVIARRTGEQWFIGAINAKSTRTFTVKLDFLTPGQKYIANRYADDPSMPTRTHVRIDRVVVDSNTALTITLEASRGEAIRLLPAISPGIQSLSRPNEGGCVLTLTGAVGLPYSLWGSSDVALPNTHWTLLSSGLITDHAFLWIDSLAQRLHFYRCSTP